MKNLIFLSLLIFATSHTRTIPKYIVDLDDTSTYTHVIADKGNAIRTFLQYNDEQLPELTGENKELIDNMTPDSFVEKYGKLANTLLYTAWYHEIPYKLLVSKFLEIKWACFAAIVEDPSGELWLLRNLDQSPKSYVQNLMADIDFYENGQHSFSGIQAVGLGLLFNATRKGEYTAAINIGGVGFGAFSSTRLLNGAFATSAVLNIIVQNAKTFEEAVALIGNTEWSRPILVILAGKKPEEKVIIELGGYVRRIKTATGKLLSIENKSVTEPEVKSDAMKEKIRNLENYSHVELIKLIQ